MFGRWRGSCTNSASGGLSQSDSDMCVCVCVCVCVYGEITMDCALINRIPISTAFEEK